MKKFSQIGIVILTIILCACVFPLCLIRKDANVDSRLDVIYEFSEMGDDGAFLYRPNRIPIRASL